MTEEGQAKGKISQRKGEIAYAYLKYVLKQKGLEIDGSFRRRVGNVAKETGIPFREALEFATDLVQEILDEVSDQSKPPSDEELEGFHSH